MSTQALLRVRKLGLVDYQSVWQAMSDFTNRRSGDDRDEIWLVEHPPIFTQGQAGKAEHLLAPGSIPVLQVDRGGQVTYHGPGQLVVYPLFDLRRLKLGVRDLVTAIEQFTVTTLAHYGIEAYPKPEAPGVYVRQGGALAQECKIASLGLRVRRGCSFHGVSINVDMDLQPFQQINPCGYAGLQMTQVRSLVDGACPSVQQVGQVFIDQLQQRLAYRQIECVHGLPQPL